MNVWWYRRSLFALERNLTTLLGLALCRRAAVCPVVCTCFVHSFNATLLTRPHVPILSFDYFLCLWYRHAGGTTANVDYYTLEERMSESMNEYFCRQRAMLV